MPGFKSSSEDLHLKFSDLILILAMMILSLIPLTNFETGNRVVISIDGKVFREIDLNISESIRIENSCGFNEIQIDSGIVYVNEANCPDQVCKKSGKISKVGDVIACLPHKILIEIK